MTREEATAYIKEWLKDEYLDGKDRVALTTIIEESEQEPKYCDRNICIQNEYNGIGCDKCEVTTRGELSSCEGCMNGNQEEKAKLCQKSYLAGMEHSKQEPCEDCISRKDVNEALRKCWLNGTVAYRIVDELKQKIDDLPPVQPKPKPKTGHCKDCKYFEHDSAVKVDGVPLIVAHEICSRWGNGCKTREDGYCFLFEPQESEVQDADSN